ncbi:MAG: UDP-glucose 4-epimerase [Cyclobacteriaceae bacterium]
MYPSLEFIFNNQHMELRELNVSRETKLFDHFPRFASESLKNELLAFKNRFAF